jgi:hypothetical protein
VTRKIVPGSRGEVNGVYQQVLVLAAVYEEGEEQSITKGAPGKG